MNVVQIKHASVKLAMKYMKRVSSELEVLAGGPDEEELMLQAVRFAFRVHQVLILLLYIVTFVK
jgi:Wiskott-Aldrich syndrome protein